MQGKLFKVDETDGEVRIDSYLAGLFENYSRTKIQDIIKSKMVLINNKPCKPSNIVHIDDEIICNLTDENCKILPENINLEIIYDDENFAIINKPSNMLTHPTSKEKTGTLVNALLYKFKDNLSNINGDYRPGIIHRLDRNTSGLIIIAKNNTAHEKLAQMIKDRLIEKHYRAIVKGRMDSDVLINESISRSKTNPAKMCVNKDGKPSLSEVTIIKQFNNYTYIDINLKTGRTHQIRVHLSHIGHPVFNDTLYGFGKMKIKTEEQVLQSYKLKFINPFNDKLIDIEIEPDSKILKILDYIKQRGE